MGTAVQPKLPKSVNAHVELGSLGAFIESSPPEESLDSREVRLIKGLLAQLDVYLLAIVGAPSLGIFNALRADIWPKYVRSLRALQETVLTMVTETQLEAATQMALTSLDSDLRKGGDEYFGDDLAQQAEFTLWTIGKIRTLGRRLMCVKVPTESRSEDAKLFGEYYTNSLWAQFHLDTLIAGIRFKKVISEEIRPQMIE